jgi:hypothetical protein
MTEIILFCQSFILVSDFFLIFHLFDLLNSKNKNKNKKYNEKSNKNIFIKKVLDFLLLKKIGV